MFPMHYCYSKAKICLDAEKYKDKLASSHRFHTVGEKQYFVQILHFALSFILSVKSGVGVTFMIHVIYFSSSTHYTNSWQQWDCI